MADTKDGSSASAEFGASPLTSTFKVFRSPQPSILALITSATSPRWSANSVQQAACAPSSTILHRRQNLHVFQQNAASTQPTRHGQEVPARCKTRDYYHEDECPCRFRRGRCETASPRTMEPRPAPRAQARGGSHCFCGAQVKIFKMVRS